jgi:predicted glycosyl hydrolase (DUF1957 family)
LIPEESHPRRNNIPQRILRPKSSAQQDGNLELWSAESTNNCYQLASEAASKQIEVFRRRADPPKLQAIFIRA